MGKTIQKKLLTSLILIVLMTNFFISNINVVYATEEEMNWAQKLENGIVIATDVLEDSLSVVMGSVIGLLTKPVRALALALADGLDDITADLAFSQGTMNSDGTIRPDSIWNDLGEAGGALLETATLGLFTFKPSVSPFDILFNKLAIVDVNFFNIPEGIGQNGIIRNFRLSIAGWYYIMRNIAAVILLCILIYVGIRMAISTVASDKAAYKKMIVDWVCSLALIFLIQYIIIFTITVNNVMVNTMKDLAGEDTIILANSMQSIKMTAKNWLTLDSIAATIVYCMLIGQTLSLLFTYINRMLKVAFLIIISPLITLTYSIDKMGDGKAQALGTWLKEFVYTVIIQTFHCIIYMVFIKMAVAILDSGLGESYNMAGSFLAVMCVKFTKDAEKLLGKIFKFGESTSDASLAVGMALSATAFSKAKNMGKGTVKAVNGVRNFAHNAAGFAHTWNVSREAVRLRKENSELTMEQAKLQAEENVSNKEAEAAEASIGKKYDAKEGQKGYDKNYKDAVDAAMKKYIDKDGLSESEAKRKAIADVAGKEIQAQKDAKHPGMAKLRDTIQPYRDTWKEFRSTDAYKQLAGVASGYVSAGAALFLGATTYGVTGKGAESLMAGGAMFKGTQEVFKSSATTMEDTTESMLKGLQVDSEVQAVNEMENIQARSDLYGNEEKLNEEIDSLWNFLDSFLHDMDKDGTNTKKTKNAIRAIIASEVKKDPEITDSALMAKVKERLSQDKSIPQNIRNQVLSAPTEKILEAVGDTANYRRRKEIYDTMQNASDLNLGPGLFSNMVGKRFRHGATSSSKVSTTGEVRDHTPDIQTTEQSMEEMKQKYAQEGLSDDEKAEIESAQRKLATDACKMRTEMLEDVTEVARQLYNEIVEQLSDASVAMTDERRKALESDLSDLLEMYSEDITHITGETKDENGKIVPSTYECINGDKVSYVTKEGFRDANALKGAIESRMSAV